MITYVASIWKVSMDSDGEFTVTMKVPASEQEAMLELHKLVRKPLLIKAEECKEK